MIVPHLVSPIKQSKNIFRFHLGDYKLIVDYDDLTFQLMLPNKYTIKRKFSFIDNPPDWFVVIDFGLTEWIEKAINWNEHAKEVKGVQIFQLEFNDQVYVLEHDTSNGELVIGMPGRLIITRRVGMFSGLPELSEIDSGELRKVILEYIKDKTRRDNSEERFNPNTFPVDFNPMPLRTKKHNYEFDYNLTSGLVYIRTPDRMLYTDVKTFDTEYREIAVMNHGKLREAIRERLDL